MTQPLSETSNSDTYYVLRRKKKAYMIEKVAPEPGFDPPLPVVQRVFGPFPSREHARLFMVRHEGRP